MRLARRVEARVPCEQATVQSTVQSTRTGRPQLLLVGRPPTCTMEDAQMLTCVDPRPGHDHQWPCLSCQLTGEAVPVLERSEHRVQLSRVDIER